MQLWKLDDTALKNKAGVWKSTKKWNFTPNDDRTVFIQTISDDNKVLGLNGDEVILELKDSKKAGQLWIKGEDRSECYFTLKNNESSKVLTAISGNSLKAKGNSKKKGIVQFCSCIIIMLLFLLTDGGVALFKSNNWKIFHLQRCPGRKKMLQNLGSKQAFCFICHASYRNFATEEAIDLHLMMAHKWPNPGNQERQDYYQFIFR